MTHNERLVAILEEHPELRPESLIFDPPHNPCGRYSGWYDNGAPCTDVTAAAAIVLSMLTHLPQPAAYYPKRRNGNPLIIHEYEKTEWSAPTPLETLMLFWESR